MIRVHNQLRDSRRSGFDPRPCRSGFSFVELLFATMLLGIGFILIAAMFPVAATQTRATQDEITAAAIARGMTDTVRSLARNNLMPPTEGQVRSIRNPQRTTGTTQDFPAGDALWNRLAPMAIDPTDPRFASVIFYRRGGTLANADPFAQLIVIVARVRDNDTYNVNNDLVGTPANLQGRPVRVRIADGTAPNPDTVEILAGPVDAVAEGAFVIISDDTNSYASGDQPDNAGRMNGRIYRVGRQTGPTTFELAPGFDFTPVPDPDASGPQIAINGLNDAEAFIVGRTFRGGNFTGGAQDIACYTTIIPVN